MNFELTASCNIILQKEFEGLSKPYEKPEILPKFVLQFYEFDQKIRNNFKPLIVAIVCKGAIGVA